MVHELADEYVRQGKFLLASLSDQLKSLYAALCDQAVMLSKNMEIEESLNTTSEYMKRAYITVLQQSAIANEYFDEALVEIRSRLEDYEDFLPLNFLPIEHAKYEPLVILGSVGMFMSVLVWATMVTPTGPETSSISSEVIIDTSNETNSEEASRPPSQEELVRRAAIHKEAEKTIERAMNSAKELNQTLDANFFDSILEDKENISEEVKSPLGGSGCTSKTELFTPRRSSRTSTVNTPTESVSYTPSSAYTRHNKN